MIFQPFNVTGWDPRLYILKAGQENSAWTGRFSLVCLLGEISKSMEGSYAAT